VGWTFRQAPMLLAGPCAVEGDDLMRRVADEVARVGLKLGLPVCFKASFDKANRAQPGAARGPGLEAGLAALERLKASCGLPLITDIHQPGQAALAAQVVDALQIPAFLCRQTDLLTAAAATGLPVNVKKGQWMAGEELKGAVAKLRGAGNHDAALTERGTFFGYGDLVVDMRNFARLREAGATVLFDATHSVQSPGRGPSGSSGGAREHVPALLAAAAAAGAEGFYLETHPDPSQALSDNATQWPLAELEELMARTLDIWAAAREGEPSRTGRGLGVR